MVAVGTGFLFLSDSFLVNIVQKFGHICNAIFISFYYTVDEITTSGKYKGKSVQLYQVILGDNKATIIFLGMIYDQQNELFKQCENVAQTLKIK